MKLREANNILYNAKASMVTEGWKVPSAFDADCIRLLLSGYGYDGFVNTLSGSMAEAGTVLVRTVELCADCSSKTFDTDLLLAVHRKLYSALYDGAGVLRKVNTRQNGSSFPDYRYVPGSLKRLLNKFGPVLARGHQTSRTEFCTILTHFYTELYLLCPFEYGNGVTCRTFLWLYARAAGFSLDYFKVPPRSFAEAENLAFSCDNVTELFNCLLSATSYTGERAELPDNARIIQPNSEPRPRRMPVRPRQTPPVQKPQDTQTAEPQKPAAPAAATQTTRGTVTELPMLEEIRLTLKAQLKSELLTELRAQLRADLVAEAKQAAIDEIRAALPPAIHEAIAALPLGKNAVLQIPQQAQQHIEAEDVADVTDRTETAAAKKPSKSGHRKKALNETLRGNLERITQDLQGLFDE